jgi:hypothetical protein
METAMMVPPELFLRSGAGSPSWIFYLNNNPLLACSCHPVLEQALRRATDLLDFLHKDHLPEIQETTGPGNLSKTVFEMREEDDVEEGGITVVGSWESIAVSKWPLSYRNDTRNWRLSNQRTFISKERV